MVDLFAAFMEGLGNFARLDIALTMVICVVIGTVVGIIPGLSNGIICALALPFIFGMDPLVALVLLSTLTSVTNSGGSISAIILGVPGVPASAATLLDGLPMTKKGEGGRAIGAALMACLMGAVLSLALALLMIPMVVPIVMKFRSPEMFLMVVVGLCFVVALVRGNRVKGFISACIGLLLSFVGTQDMTGASRFTFHSAYLYSGLDLLVTMLGLFAVPVFISNMVSGKTIAPPKSASAGRYTELLQGARDVFKHWNLWLRSSLLGYLVGLIPGVGSETAIWASYGQAKQTSKNPEKFGTGCIEGVIAPESAQNAKEGAALLTTLTFGIPGSGIMAFFLAAFLIVGIQPGPKLWVDHTSICFTMLLAVAFSNILGGILCFLVGNYIIKISRVSPIYLFAIIMPILCIGCYISNRAVEDLILMFVIGILGVCMQRFGYSMPAMILGFILGKLSEYYLWHSLDIFGPIFFTSPISIVMVAVIIFILCQDVFKYFFKIFALSLRRNQ